MQWLLAVFTVILVIRLLMNNREEVTRLFQFEVWQVFTVLILYLLMFVSSRMPFFYIIRKFQGKSLPFFEWLRIMVASTMANTFLPQSGHVYRAVSLKDECDLKYSQYIEVFALFGWITTLLDLLLTAIVISIFLPNLAVSGVPVLFLISGVLFGIFAAPFLALKTMEILNPENSFLKKIHTKSMEILSAISQYGKNLNFLLNVVFFGILSFIISVFLFKHILAGIDVEAGYAHIALLVAIKKLTGFIIITPGNLGVQELVYGFVCDAIGIGAAQGIMASLLLRIAAYFAIFPVAIILGGHKLIFSFR